MLPQMLLQVAWALEMHLQVGKKILPVTQKQVNQVWILSNGSLLDSAPPDGAKAHQNLLHMRQKRDRYGEEGVFLLTSDQPFPAEHRDGSLTVNLLVSRHSLPWNPLGRLC